MPTKSHLLNLLFAAMAAMAGLFGCPPVRAEAAGTAVVLTVDGVIGPAAADYVERGLAEARARHAGLVVLQLDTPGGLDSAMRDIVRAILASPVPVAGFVSPGGARAASAGTYILYASHIAAMAPGTNLGAATPVQLFGFNPPLPESPPKPDGAVQRDAKSAPAAEEEPSRDVMTVKITNDAVAYIRSLAALRGRNADWAEQAVRKAVSLPADQAVAQHVVDFIASDIPDLLAKANGRQVTLGGRTVTLATAGLVATAIAPGWRTKLLALITDPELAYMLMLLGIVGIVFEVSHPGMAAPGVFGGIGLLLGLYGLHHLPIDYAAAGLVLLGLGLMIAEAFVPAYGALGVGGVAAFVIGSLMLFDTDLPGYRLPLVMVVAAGIAAALLLILVVTLSLRARRRPVVTGEATLIGAGGEVLAWSADAGQVQIGAERWNARSAGPLSTGQRVRVVGRDGLTLLVGPEDAARA
ncbi:MAG TPA: nodulation protein NfeD [Candidatus Sulfotelmatobacter sp.]|nr:nodulation protein NfeD [Candidatus Sulfotelmatobacter sp.]